MTDPGGPRRPTIHLTCGLPCAGKTTLARQIERDAPALRLTPDEWIVGMFGVECSREQMDALRTPLETLLWGVAERAVTLGINVVVDFGLWSRSEREDFRARVAGLGARSELHFLDVPLDELVTRLAARNAELPPGTFPIDESELRLWWTWFEPPEEDELPAREAPSPQEEGAVNA